MPGAIRRRASSPRRSGAARATSAPSRSAVASRRRTGSRRATRARSPARSSRSTSASRCSATSTPTRCRSTRTRGSSSCCSGSCSIGPMADKSPSQLIDERIAELGDWRGEMLGRLRGLVKEADPDIVEEWKWRGVPTWEHDGIICTGETYKSVVKMTFAKGASLEDPSGLFNSSLDGNVRRAIDFHEGDKVDEKALKALIRAAVALNESKTKR